MRSSGNGLGSVHRRLLLLVALISSVFGIHQLLGTAHREPPTRDEFANVRTPLLRSSAPPYGSELAQAQISTPRPPTPSPTPQSPQISSALARLPFELSLEKRATDFVIFYYLLWSRTAVDVSSLEKYYSEAPLFYGSRTLRFKIMDDKRKFAARWPVRNYVVRNNTMSVQCSRTCLVSGIVDWDARSVERGAHSIGAADFTFTIELNEFELGGTIISESGVVLSN